MLKKLFIILNSHITSGDTIIVGASGGPDSTALVDLLVRFSEKTPCRLVLAHINHGIRGKEADADETFVRQLTKKHHLLFRLLRVRLKGKSGVEEKGRKVRRAFFEKLRTEYTARWIITAHTQDDHVESILMHFIRGSGPAGLAGIRLISGYYFRPLITITKKEIHAYLKRQKIAFCHDRTNDYTVFLRNYLRKKVIPLLTQLNPSLYNTLARSSQLFAALDSYIMAQAKLFLEQHGSSDNTFLKSAYMELPHFLKLAVLQELHHRVTGDAYSLPLVQVSAAARMIERGIGRKKITCSGKAFFSLQKGRVQYNLCS